MSKQPLGVKTDTKPKKAPFKAWQIRWNEPLGVPECPYLYRWVLNTPWGSVRIHRWVHSEVEAHFHDHPFSFWTFVLKGSYTDVSPKGREVLRRGYHRFRPAEYQHYVEVPKGGCWTLLFCSNVQRNWGYWVNGKLRRPAKYFGKFGHPPCDL